MRSWKLLFTFILVVVLAVIGAIQLFQSGEYRKGGTIFVIDQELVGITAQKLDAQSIGFSSLQVTKSEPKPVQEQQGLRPKLELVPNIGDQPAWKAELDEPRFDYTTVSNFEFEWRDDLGTAVFAALNGPFVLIPVQGQPLERSKVATEVIDLRTGKPIGQFSNDFYFHPQTMLGPNGKSIISYSESNALGSWSIDEPMKKHSISLESAVAPWMGYVSKSKVAIVTAEGDRASGKCKDTLILWNIETGETQSTLELPYESYGSNINQWRHECAAVSPRGKYIAIAGTHKLIMVRTDDLAILGSIDIPGLSSLETAIRFSDDAKSLFVYSLTPTKNLHVFEFDAMDGRLRNQREFLCQDTHQMKRSPEGYFLDGSPIWSTTEYAVFSGSEYQGQSQPPRILKLDDPNSKSLPFNYLARMNETGPVWVCSYADGKRLYKQEPREPIVAFITKDSENNTFGKLSNVNLVGVQSESQAAVQQNPSSDWVPLTKGPVTLRSEFTELDYNPRYLRNSQNSLISFWEKKQSDPSGQNVWEAKFRTHDPVTGHFLPDELSIRKWQHSAMDGYKGWGSEEAFDVAPDGNQYAFSDPEQRDVVHVVQRDGTRVYSFQPFGKTKTRESFIGKIHYLEEQKLVVVGLGQFAAIDVSGALPKFIYRSPKIYQGDAHLLPGKTHLAVGGNNFIDLVETATGRCQNRIYCPPGDITNLCSSEDGLWLAAALKVQNNYHIVAWNLETGEGVSLETTSQDVSRLVWLSPTHLQVLHSSLNQEAKDLKVYDVHLKSHSLTYRLPKQGYFNPDGSTVVGIWLQDIQSVTKVNGPEVQPRWVRVPSTPDELPYFANDRKINALADSPMSIHLDLRSYAWGQRHSKKVAEMVQERGLHIGKGSYELHVKTSSVPSGKEISNVNSKGKQLARYPIPKVVYRWSLRHSSGDILWEGTSEGEFLGERSKYYRGAAQGSSGMQSWDFGSGDMDKSFTNEIIENGIGLEFPKTFPTHVIEGGGKSGVFPKTIEWRIEPK